MGKVGTLKRLSRVALFVGIAAALVGVPLAASANPDVSGFELDGNAASSGAADWNALGSPLDFTGFIVDPTGTSDTGFTTGGSKDTLDVSQWKWVDRQGRSRQGQHRERVCGRLRRAEQPHPLLRAEPRPRQERRRECRLLVPAELGRPERRTARSPGSHKDGDILVQSEFTNGGSVSGVQIYKWQSGGARRSSRTRRSARATSSGRRTRARS